jgi:hypothetical protein
MAELIKNACYYIIISDSNKNIYEVLIYDTNQDFIQKIPLEENIRYDTSTKIDPLMDPDTKNKFVPHYIAIRNQIKRGRHICYCDKHGHGFKWHNKPSYSNY